jgi:molybdate transport system ATP-binding protein
MTNPSTEPASGPIVSIEHTDVKIDGQPILTGLNWQLLPGRHFGIIGANGSGKSTLLRLIAGTLWPAPGAGRRYYDFGNGQQRDAIDARTRIVDVGPELQNRYTKFGWNFKVLDIVLSGISKTDTPRRNSSAAAVRSARQLIESLDLGALAERRLLELSRGEQRRVLIARAMAFSPRVLLLDEPASGLDQAARQHLNKLLERVAADTTIVATAHHAADLPAIVSDHAELIHGRLRSVQAMSPVSESADDGIDLVEACVADARPSQADSPLIQVRGTSIYLRERAILRDVDWQLREGEHWLVTGRNGSGKSTFLRLLHGQVRPALGGSIAWPALGNPRNIWSLRRQVGYVSAELHAGYRYRATASECIGSGIDSSYGLTRKLSPAEQDAVDQLLDRYELRPLADRQLSTLSYGQMHRVLIARTLINRPRVLLLDEPWEGLDLPTRHLVARELSASMKSGMQVVCVSHVIESRLRLNRHLLIADGRISRVGADA